MIEGSCRGCADVAVLVTSSEWYVQQELCMCSIANECVGVGLHVRALLLVFGCGCVGVNVWEAQVKGSGRGTMLMRPLPQRRSLPKSI